MRLLWLSVLVTALAMSPSMAEEESFETARRILRSWDHDAPTVHIEPAKSQYTAMESEEEDSHIRTKRQTLGVNFLAADKACQTPGFTGEFCENPICPTQNMDVPNPSDSDEVTFDMAHLANCSDRYVILIDETMYIIQILIETDAPINPWFSLQAEDGSIIVPNAANVQQDEYEYKALWPAIPPGRYVVIPFADLKNSYCIMIARARSALNVQGGFVSDESIDARRSDFPMIRQTYLNVQSKGIFHANNMRAPAKLRAVGMTGANLVYLPNPLTERYNCSYEYIYDGFLCRQKGDYMYHVEGVTWGGYGFRRLNPVTCVDAPPMPTTAVQTTVSPTPVSQCLNGGVLITNPDGSSYCFCQGLWTGENCQQILCMNGGTMEKNKCWCDVGYQGDHCQDVVCGFNAGLGFDASHPTMTFVIRARSQMNDVITQVLAATENLITALQHEPEYLANFILVLFNNNKIVSSESYKGWSNMRTAMQAAANSTDNSGECHDVVFSSINAALNRFPTFKSPVYVITDVPASDVDQADLVAYQDSQWRAPINFIYVRNDGGCIISNEDVGYRNMDILSQRTSGNLFSVLDRTKVEWLTYQHMIGTVYRSQLMFSNDLQLCSQQMLFQTASIDSSAQTLTIVATGRGLGLVITIPEGTTLDPTKAYDDGVNYIWTVNGAHTGQWMFNLLTNDNSTGCSMRIFQKSYNNLGVATEQFDIFWAFSPSIDSDGFFTQPLYDFTEGVVVHMNDYPLDIPSQYNYASLVVYANRNGRRKEIYASNGIWRDMCAYQFYFPKFTCQVPNELLYFTFFANDDRGKAIQRAGTMICATIQPPLNPPSSCQNGGVMNPANTTCFCPLGWTGTYCGAISCFNGGTPGNSQCSCPLGWTGQFCELGQCLTPGVPPELQMKFVDMVFAVELTQVGIAQVAMLNTNFPEIIRDIQSQNAEWISRFVLIGFNTTWADVLNVSPANDPSALIATLDQITQQVGGDRNADKGCGVQVWKALDIAILKRDIVPGSFIQLFVSTTPDNSDQGNWNMLYEFTRSMNLRITAFQGVSPRNTDNPQGYYCNATQTDWLMLDQLTSSSLGDTYPTQPGIVQAISRIIPLQYFSGQVLAGYEQDCNHPMQMYFPIDSYVQTIQLDVFGMNPTIQLLDGNGNVYPMLELARDAFSGLLIAEVRKPCDDDWYNVGQYCIRFEANTPLSWPEAAKFCHDAGGFLADDMSQDKHNYIISKTGAYSFWIGLFNNGSGFAWDRPYNIQPAPLNQAQSFWSDGQLPTDPTKQCTWWNGANRNQGNTWTADTCSQPRFFMCQKHQYDQDYRPDAIQDNDLAAGKWYVNVTTAPTAGQTKECYVNIRVQSQLQIRSGFTLDMTQDTPNNDPIRDAPNNQMMTYVHSLDNSNRIPILSNAYITDAYNNTFYNAARYNFRDGCQWPWISQTFECPNPMDDGNEFRISHTGEDTFGYMFQRVTFGHCSRQVLTCGNGGYKYQGQCICNEYWQGKDCTIPICVNNGTLQANDRSCSCPTGFTGNNCQYPYCEVDRPITFFPSSKSFVLVVEHTVQNKDAITQLANNIVSIINTALLKDNNWYINYVLMTYDSSGMNFVAEYENPTSLSAALNSRASSVADPGSCSMPLYTALSALMARKDIFDLVQYPYSDLLIVSSSGASDEANRKDDLNNLSYSAVIVHYLYMASTACSDAPTDGSLPNIVRMAYTSNGNVAFLNSTDLPTFLTAYLPTRYAASTLTTPTYHTNFQCSGNKWYVQVDKNITQIYVSTSAMFGSIGGNDPMKQVISATPLYNVGQQKLYQIDTYGIGGVYTLNFVSPGNCYAAIYSVGGASVYSQFAVPTATDPTAFRQDGQFHAPWAYRENVLTAHLQATASFQGILQYAEIYDVDAQKSILRSELYPRSACGMEYVSDIFTCDSDLLVVYIYGMDSNNQQFRRQSVAYCQNSTQIVTPAPGQTTLSPQTPQPAMTTAQAPQTSADTPVPPASTATPAVVTLPAGQTTGGTTPIPTTSYGNANLRFDVVFLIDVSASASGLLTDMTNFVKTLMVSYSVGINYARVGLITVNGDDSLGAMAVANLNSISSQSTLISNLNQLMTDYSDFGDQGQYLAQSLAVATNINFLQLSNGYRPTLPNHLIIYITANSTFSDNPTTDAIRAANTYGFITIGYGQNANDAAGLGVIAGGADCAFTATDFNDLNRNVLPKVQTLIFNADTTGKYCGN